MVYYAYMGIVFFFILGLIIGSFLNAVIYRLHTQESVAKGRSHCFTCQQQLNFWDLIPIFSFIGLGGRCRYCRVKISWQYPLVECITGLLFAGIGFYFFQQVSSGPTLMWWLLVSLILVCFALIIFVYDWRYYLVADQIVWPAIIIMITANLWLFKVSWISLIGAAAGLMLFFWLQIVLSHGRWVGSGDISLGLLMGVSLGWPRAIVGLLMAYWLGGLVSIILLFTKKKSLDSQIPFGPFLMIGLLIAWFFGSYLIAWWYV